MEGILLVDKPSGMTSHDVVQRLRKITGIQRVGHTGTLDPQATGLMIICFGRTTKLSLKFSESDKIYQVRFLLGLETDTYDSTGKVIDKKPVNITEMKLEELILDFKGIQQQRPPLYSAVKVRGRKLYEYARRNIPVEAPLRTITIYSLKLLSYDSPRGVLEVNCSKGTYVRTLVHDIGQKLGVGAVAEAIRRTQSGMFRVEMALTLDQIQNNESPKAFVSSSLLAFSNFDREISFSASLIS